MIGIGSISQYYAFSRSLRRSTEMINQALLRMGTGSRVNSVKDGAFDVAQMATLDAQARGLSQAMTNVSDAQAVTATADTALGTMLDLTQSIRELALQAQDSSLTTEERDALQEEAQSLLDELNFYASNTEYNSKSLLNGSFGSMKVQAYPSKNGSYSFSLGDARTSTLGRLAIISGTDQLIVQAFTSSSNVTINGVTIASSSSDGVSTVVPAGSAIAKATAINGVSEKTGVYAEALENVITLQVDLTATAYIGGVTNGIINAGEFKINGVNVSGQATTAAALVNLVNAQSDSTGVVASVVSSNQVKFTAVDGRNVNMIVSNGGSGGFWDVVNNSTNTVFGGPFHLQGNFSVGVQTTLGARIRLWSAKDITVIDNYDDPLIGYSNISISSTVRKVDAGTAVGYLNLKSTSAADQAVKVLDRTIEQISALQADVGAIHNRLQYSSSYLESQLNSVEGASAAFGDADLALEQAKLVKGQILQDATIAAMAQANVSAITVVRLLDSLPRTSFGRGND